MFWLAFLEDVSHVCKVLNEHYQLPNVEKVLFELEEDNEGRDNIGKPVEDATDFDVCIREETIFSRKRKFKVFEKDIDDAVEDVIKLVEDSLSNKLSKKGIKGAKQLKRNNNMKKESIKFYLVARKAVQGSVMCILLKCPGCKYIMSTGDYKKQIKCSGCLIVLIL